MAVTPYVNEGTSLVLGVAFTDMSGASAAPSAATYRIDCITTGTAILGATALTPAAAVDIHITGAQNAIITTGNAYETKRVTVEWTAGAYSGTDEYIYAVKNLGGVP